MSLNLTRRIKHWKRGREGIRIGTAVASGGQPVYLSRRALASHSLLVGDPRTGKTTLLTHLASQLMWDGRSLIVIDAEGDLVDSLVGLVPKSRVGEVLYVDLGDTHRVITFNPIEVKAGQNPDVIVASVVRAARRVWHKYWDVDVEGLLTAGLYTLVAANEALAQKGEPQLTLADLSSLLDSLNFRRRLVNMHVRNPLLAYFWMGFFERELLERRGEIFIDCECLVRNSTLYGTACHILGQSASAFDWPKILSTRHIVLVKTDARRQRWDSQGLPSACLLDQLFSAVRDQRAIGARKRREPLPILVDGYEPLVYPDQTGLLEELKVLGVTLAFSAESLAEMDGGSKLSQELLSSDPNLFVFSTNDEDGKRLLPELDDVVSPDTLRHLPPGDCFVRQRGDEQHRSIEWMEMLPPRKGDPSIAAEVVRRSQAYTRPIEYVEAEREEFKEHWQGQEPNLIAVASASESEPGPDSEREDQPRD